MNNQNFHPSETSPFSGTPKYLRQMIFSFLDTSSIKNKISLLSKEERDNLLKYFFINDGRQLTFYDKFFRRNSEECMACQESKDKISLKIYNHASLFDEVMIIIDSLTQETHCVASHDTETFIANLIAVLPERLNKGKITMYFR